MHAKIAQESDQSSRREPSAGGGFFFMGQPTLRMILYISSLTLKVCMLYTKSLTHTLVFELLAFDFSSSSLDAALFLRDCASCCC
jgi:hypothetical protein